MKINEIHHFLFNKGLEGDCFWLLDVLLLLGGIESTWSSRWKGKQLVRYFTNALFTFQTIVFILQFHQAMIDKQQNTASVVLQVIKLAAISVTILKLVVLIVLTNSIALVKIFVSSSHVKSGNDSFDKIEQMKLKQSSNIIMGVVYVLIIAETIFLSIPNKATEIAFSAPHALAWTNKYGSAIFQFLIISLLPIGTYPRFFSNITTTAILLLGMRMKLKMLAHRYERMLKLCCLEDDYYYDCLRRELKVALKQHMEYWRNLRIIKDLVGKMFFVVHYFAIFSIGALFYISKDIGLNFMSLAIVGTILFMLQEYYVWCYLIDLFQDEVASIGNIIFELSSQIPYVGRRHSEYVQIKTSLMIISINNGSGFKMSCCGLFRISTTGFVSLIDIVYSVLMFLINVG
ncbi:AAEL017505-PA [Aedes aegypti]|nr:AAEL017505-PA [Aedes aegypti]DAA80433.1 TPA_exp: odorant receptor 103 [Aedes aegypti]